MSGRLVAEVMVSVNLPALRFNQYNVAMLQAPSHSIRPDLERIIAQEFASARVLVFGGDIEFAERRSQLFICHSEAEVDSLLSRNRNADRFDLAICFSSDAERVMQKLAGAVDDLILIPAPDTLVADRFAKLGFVADSKFQFGADAVRLTRLTSARFADLNRRLQQMERMLRTRMSELEAADRHIAKLEEKVLKLRETRKQLKQLKAEKQALRKSPERKVGQVLLAPYLLPKKLVREIQKWRGHKLPPSPKPDSAKEYQAWLSKRRVGPQEVTKLREIARLFSHQPLISIITPIFDTPVAWLEEAIASTRAQAYENWELLLIDDGSSDQALLQAVPDLVARDQRIVFAKMESHKGISAASNEGLARA
ncbi:MAG: glycosyltransferase, partial [Verrucomicrobiota bacterium]